MKRSRIFFVIVIFVIAFVFSSTATAFAEEKEEYVYLGGIAVGLSTLGEGLYVDGEGVVDAANGEASPFKGKFKDGDILLKVNGKDVSSRLEVAAAVREGENTLLVYNAGETRTITGKGVRDKEGNVKLGVYLSTSVEGVGTLSFVTAEKRFCALGHAATSFDGVPARLYQAKITPCKVLGVSKSATGKPGQLNGATTDVTMGEIYINDDYGVYGKMIESYSSLLVPIKSRYRVKLGEAQVYMTIEGNTPDYYDVEIIRADFQPAKAEKGMTVKITDERLLEKCGGIVRGMSGSPILQDGALVGALTHVFINDALKGYAVYADFLMEEVSKV
ncbi:MAG: hypothetical protein IJS93_02885 [Clostridia bacterium]|nr:hypothetical protein [Clostridia bacterium]